MLLALLLTVAQTTEPDLSRYGSLARQQIVRENLRLQAEAQEIRARENLRRSMPQPTTIIYAPPTYRYSDYHLPYSMCGQSSRSCRGYVGSQQDRRSEVLYHQARPGQQCRAWRDR